MLDAGADVFCSNYNEVQHALDLRLKTVFFLPCASAMTIWQDGLVELVPFLVDGLVELVPFLVEAPLTF